MPEESKTYMAYLLRLWRETDNSVWRATLEAADTGERINFATPKELALYLFGLTDYDLSGEGDDIWF